jgi:hypothetical protein
MHKKLMSVQQQKKLHKSTRSAAKPTVATVTPGVLALQGQVGNGAVQRLLTHLQRQPIQRAEDKKPPSAIGYVGLNPQAGKEAKALDRGARDQVIVSLDDLKEQAVLQTKEGKAEFVRSRLGIDPQNKAKFALALACLEQCESAFCDQMADMLEMFGQAEQGKYELERLVLSGHQAAGRMWGEVTDTHEPGGILINRDLPNLVKAFPVAAAQIEDLMFSACNTKDHVERCAKLFPNLKSVWVYKGSSPRIDQGSAQHIVAWEQKTRGAKMPRRRDGMGNIVIWTREKGFSDEPEKA